MKPIPAIIESDVAPHAAAVDHAIRQLREAEQHEAAALGRWNTARNVTARMRLELGRALVAARKCWPPSGPRAKGWGDFLKVRALDQDVALDAMKYAGYVEERFPGTLPEELPTRREAGIVDRDATPANAPSLVLVPQQPELTEDQLLEALDRLDPDARGRIQRSLRSKQGRENEGDRDAYCTPLKITELLPEVDFDPCSNPRSTVRARRMYQLERGENGLEISWVGSGFWNIPYSKPLPWAEKFDRERVGITAAGWLVNADHSPAWWHLLTRSLLLRLDFDERLEFAPAQGVEVSKNDRPQTLLMDAAFWAACNQVELLKLGKLWRREHNT